MTEVNEEALDKAAREGYAVRCKTHGPRVLDKYAADDIMARQLADARVIVSAYIAALYASPVISGTGLIDWRRNCQYLLDILDDQRLSSSDLSEGDDDTIAHIRSLLGLGTVEL